MRSISKIIIHCSATTPEMDHVDAALIRQWHTSPDANDSSKPWKDIGYHWVIKRDGTVEPGRPESKQGAHCAAGNGNVASIGICMVGGVKRVPDGKTAAGKPKTKLVAEDNFTLDQYEALRKLVRQIQKRYAIKTILGHRDLDPRKACPSFSVRDRMAAWAVHEMTWV